jgi:lactoylglutathione lyase
MIATPRPFRVLGLQQIAVGGLSKEPLRRLYVDLLGLHSEGSYRSEKENVDEDILACGAGVARVEVDVMQPIDPDKKPKVHDPALNHVGFWVDDLAAAVAWLGEQGVRFTPGGIRKGAAGFDVCFIHPKGDAGAPQGGEGVLIELVQAPPAVIDAFAALAAASASA